MVESIESKLLKMEKEQLAGIVLTALDTMGELEQIEFIARHIDARVSLARLNADDPSAFLSEVDMFCLDCLNKAYYSDDDDVENYFSSNDYDDSYYDDEWDYDEYYRNTEWVRQFARLLKLSMMYIRSGDVNTGYEANARLLSCLNTMKSDDSFLGTDHPVQYIFVDWDELFMLHYDALFQYYNDAAQTQAIEKAFRCWVDFGGVCDEGFLDNVKDADVAGRLILDELKSSHDWDRQRQCFVLLMRLYARLGKAFDKAAYAEMLLEYNDYFALYVVDGLCEQANWQSAVKAALAALEKIPLPASDTSDWHKNRTQEEIRAAIHKKLVDSYEALYDYPHAFECVKRMFLEAPAYDLYLRARGLAEKKRPCPNCFHWPRIS